MSPSLRELAGRPAARWTLAVVATGALVASVLPRGQTDEREASWSRLIVPLAEGEIVHDGYVLSRPRRGEEHDVVFSAVRRAAGAVERVEVHVVARGQWEGVRETRSFGVAYEAPRSSAPEEDLRAVTSALAQAIDGNDPGGLGPVDSIALDAGIQEPALTRALRGVVGARGWIAAVALLLLTLSLAFTGRGALVSSLGLFFVGLALRFAHLSIPFVRDQDVQRVVSGSHSVLEILTGEGLMDRHPPLYFLVLHFVQMLGQDEWMVRMPAAIFGALVGPAILLVANWTAPRARAQSAALAALVTIAPALVASAREVSEIPLFALALILMVGSTVRATQDPTRRTLVWVCATHALTLWVYYLGPFAIAGEGLALLVLFWRGEWRSDEARGAVKKTLGWAALGVALGSPSMALAVATLIRDHGARTTAAAHPGLAWGQWGPMAMAREIAARTIDVTGLALLVAFGAVFVFAFVRRSRAPMLAAGAAMATTAAVIFMTPIARMQPYYILAVIPLGLLALATVELPERVRVGAILAIFMMCAFPMSHTGPALGHLYAAPDDAVVGRYAETAAREDARQIVTVAHYDAILMAYYLARAHERPLVAEEIVRDDSTMRVEGIDTSIIGLAYSHSVDGDTEREALARLSEALDRGPTWVLSRSAFQLPAVERVLERCTLMDESPETRFMRCE